MLPNDPIMLVSFLNLKLRDNYESLDALCDDLDVDKEALLEKLKKADFKYDSANNQIR
ncbi:MAG: DUF4250 domain-containing protein [Lachnospiraceae bacterium]|nr:DUF4250 domain-containing protein [Lachnospiraceae bacterium]